MHNIFSSFSTPSKIDVNNGDNNSTIFYNFVGNFIPPEWSTLSSHNGKILSKTARQLLSLIVFRLQIYYNNSIDELQETYHFFEQHLSVCQRRVRQCLLELEQSGFINLSTSTIIKYGIKCRNTPCIKLAKDFQPYNHKSSAENEKNFSTTRKIFRTNPKEISAQPEKNFAHNIYIDNNKNISNKSRSSESIILQNEQNETVQNQQLLQYSPKQNLAQELKFATTRSAHYQQESENAKTSESNFIIGPLQVNKALQAILDKVDQARCQQIASPSDNTSAVKSVKNKGWFKRKKLADFYPLSQEDADLLQVESRREFNLDFINKLLLKLAAQYPAHHFGHKKVFLNYMAKALVCELREATQANSSMFQFKSSLHKAKEQYLDKIESSNNISKQAQLKRKIVGSFDSDTAYELLSSCCFMGAIDNQYQIKLLKDIRLAEHSKDKILQQVQTIYGAQVKQLQIIPPLVNAVSQKENDPQQADQTYLLALSKQLDPASVWYKVRKFLIERYNRYVDIGTLSKLTVIMEDTQNKKIIIQAKSSFYDYFVRNRYMNDLADAFQMQGFTFELLKFNDKD
ncbi:MAG: hypothetical protein LN546_04965 [Rickettsia endosymbiont of Ecitomorpha arachnoides]|nr:hypothetical protein [Rickettsia endosymbiont of Ecitomorpha arachnoides]